MLKRSRFDLYCHSRAKSECRQPKAWYIFYFSHLAVLSIFRGPRTWCPFRFVRSSGHIPLRQPLSLVSNGKTYKRLSIPQAGGYFPDSSTRTCCRIAYTSVGYGSKSIHQDMSQPQNYQRPLYQRRFIQYCFFCIFLGER